MAVNPRVMQASTALSLVLKADGGRLTRVAQIGGQRLSRMDCFISKPWRKMAAGLPDRRLGAAAIHLLDTYCSAVPGSDYDSWYFIDRQALHALSDSARPTRSAASDHLVELWLATMIWGHARDNRGPEKVAGALSDYNSVVTSLRYSMDLIDAGSLAATYAACDYRGRGYLKGFGESFFTKWLWSAGLAAGNQPLPLVFDDRVRSALSAIGPAWALVGGNQAKRYVDYCQLASDVAEQLSGTLGHIDAEKVEYALYCM